MAPLFVWGSEWGDIMWEWVGNDASRALCRIVNMSGEDTLHGVVNIFFKYILKGHGEFPHRAVHMCFFGADFGFAMKHHNCQPGPKWGLQGECCAKVFSFMHDSPIWAFLEDFSAPKIVVMCHTSSRHRDILCMPKQFSRNHSPCHRFEKIALDT